MGDIDLIWVGRKWENFCKWGWTGEITELSVESACLGIEKGWTWECSVLAITWIVWVYNRAIKASISKLGG